MKQYTANNLVIHSGNSGDPDVVVEVTPEAAGWGTIHFQARRLRADQVWSFDSGANELALVMLGGVVDVTSNRGAWQQVGGRADVFAGPPHALYLPPQTAFTVTAATECEFAVTWVASNAEHAPVAITPADVRTEIRGGGHATRQINNIIPPGFPCARLVVVEVYTPGGNWSSYPPHKHDVHREDGAGALLEADLDETYYYKIDRPEGYALQRVYTDASSPLHRAGYPIDAAVIARNDDVVLIPEGYHPVSSPVGYTTYYLNVLAGSAQSLTAVDDPDYAWVKQTYQSTDPRIPLYPVNAD
ncbi:MAG: 5-deoxy-glucuronate isomerase [Anaerolineales bacterium]|nr:5-deoxy-glucuronate isomerase [Anaerolineales bacterium]